MSDRVNYFHRQKVTESELDLAFDQLEQADHRLATDLDVFGIISGAMPTEHAQLRSRTFRTKPVSTSTRLLFHELVRAPGSRTGALPWWARFRPPPDTPEKEISSDVAN